MAIVEMSKLSVICLNSLKTHFIKELMELGVVEIDSLSNNKSDNSIPEGAFISNNTAEVSRLDAKIAVLSAAMEALNSYKKGKAPLISTRREISADEFSDEAEKNTAEVEKIAERTGLIQKDIIDKKNEINKLELLFKGLEPWESLDIPLEMTQTKTACVFMGSLPVKANMNDVLNSVLEKAPSVVIQQVSSDKTQIYVCTICLKEERAEALLALREFGYISVSLGDNKGTAAESQKAYAEKIEQLNKDIADDKEALIELAEHTSEMEVVYDDYILKRDRAKAVGEMINTQKVFCFNGWLPTASVDKVKRLLDKYECYYEISEPIKDESTPILLKNGKFTAPFETVTQMYSLPLATEIDPTPILAPFYFVFFGMMLSDAAYGIIMSLLCFIALKKFKLEGTMEKMIKMFFWCGISTCFWGALFGGWFGDVVPVFTKTFFGHEVAVNPIWFDPMSEPMTLLIFSLILGAIHLFVGMAVQAYMLIKAGKPWDALFDIGFWYMLLIGLVLFALGGSVAAVLASVGKWMAIIGAVGILLTGGRSKKGFGKITGGLGSLYGITSYLSDILSYSRLLALGLATGVVAKVVNMLGSLAGNGIIGLILFIVVFLIGNVFNIAINALGAFVHSCRLQYVEFFGKFFTGGGRPFEPFTEKTKFIKIINKEEI